ncbi:phosphotransferase [Sutcliffiella horikoshii]|uniref:phosphotransferase n=1 Tax=Sutcliffiella horikoshii TaxID=79883 RepID=UPI003CEA4701
MEENDKIIDVLESKGLLWNAEIELKRMNSGTTSGVLYTLLLDKNPAYVIKIDDPKIINSTKDFLLAYKEISVLPDVIYADQNDNYIVYTYIPGETHNNRGSKLEWMTLLIQELFTKYNKVENDTSWGRVNGIHRSTWSDFNNISFQLAQECIGNHLPNEDHRRVKELVEKLRDYHDKEEKYYLHGDTGIHNFVYYSNKLVGVIDPSPLIGPRIYDFTYAFCSSPDSLNIETLLPLFALWKENTPCTVEHLIGEVIFQLYTRIGTCIKVHPQDFSSYMKVWSEWREYLS